MNPFLWNLLFLVSFSPKGSCLWSFFIDLFFIVLLCKSPKLWTVFMNRFVGSPCAHYQKHIKRMVCTSDGLHFVRCRKFLTDWGRGLITADWAFHGTKRFFLSQMKLFVKFPSGNPVREEWVACLQKCLLVGTACAMEQVFLAHVRESSRKFSTNHICSPSNWPSTWKRMPDLAQTLFADRILEMSAKMVLPRQLVVRHSTPTIV